jgi:hypothetical protein
MRRIIARLKVELIILFAYLGGILVLAGFFMDSEFYFPENPMWQVNAYIEALVPDVYVRITLALLHALALGLLVKQAFAIGGPGAIIGVVMGFLAGLATPTDLVIGLIMLGIGLACGYFAITGLKTLKGSWVMKPRL